MPRYLASFHDLLPDSESGYSTRRLKCTYMYIKCTPWGTFVSPETLAGTRSHFLGKFDVAKVQIKKTSIAVGLRGLRLAPPVYVLDTVRLFRAEMTA